MLLSIASVCLLISIFVPIWRIELDAPQYPEGLLLQIYANKLGGDVQIINGLNHYIGMKTLHEDDFIEFTVLPYIIGAFALMSLITMFVAGERGLYILFTAFVLFGIIAMVDFWRWEYDYGHNLDPHAAIIVPGMAYQPPLIGFKQLLNFGAYSIPDIGGWLFVASGICMLFAVIWEIRNRRTSNRSKVVFNSAIFASMFFISCSPVGPEPIKINADHCDNCKMMISDIHFASELITDKGRIYKFDDVICMLQYMDNHEFQYKSILVSDYNSPNELHEATKLCFVKSGKFKSPMGGNVAAFINEAIAAQQATDNNVEVMEWNILKAK